MRISLNVMRSNNKCSECLDIYVFKDYVFESIKSCNFYIIKIPSTL